MIGCHCLRLGLFSSGAQTFDNQSRRRRWSVNHHNLGLKAFTRHQSFTRTSVSWTRHFWRLIATSNMPLMGYQIIGHQHPKKWVVKGGGGGKKRVTDVFLKAADESAITGYFEKVAKRSEDKLFHVWPAGVFIIPCLNLQVVCILEEEWNGSQC